MHSQDHFYLPNSITILDREDNWHPRGIKESIHIRATNLSLNANQGRHKLQHCYDNIIKNTIAPTDRRKIKTPQGPGRPIPIACPTDAKYTTPTRPHHAEHTHRNPKPHKGPYPKPPNSPHTTTPATKEKAEIPRPRRNRHHIQTSTTPNASHGHKELCTSSAG
jgi:hypothetical protein